MKYQALRPPFFSVVGWVMGWVGVWLGGGGVDLHDTPHHGGGGMRCPPCYFLRIW